MKLRLLAKKNHYILCGDVRENYYMYCTVKDVFDVSRCPSSQTGTLEEVTNKLNGLIEITDPENVQMLEIYTCFVDRLKEVQEKIEERQEKL